MYLSQSFISSKTSLFSLLIVRIQAGNNFILFHIALKEGHIALLGMCYQMFETALSNTLTSYVENELGEVPIVIFAQKDSIQTNYLLDI